MSQTTALSQDTITPTSQDTSTPTSQDTITMTPTSQDTSTMTPTSQDVNRRTGNARRRYNYQKCERSQQPTKHQQKSRHVSSTKTTIEQQIQSLVERKARLQREVEQIQLLEQKLIQAMADQVSMDLSSASCTTTDRW